MQLQAFSRAPPFTDSHYSSLTPRAFCPSDVRRRRGRKSRFIHPLVWALIQDVVSRVRPPTLLCVGTPLHPAPLGPLPPLPFLFLALIKCHLKNLYGSPSESRCEWIEAEGGREGGAGRITPRRNANATSQFRRKGVLLSQFPLFNQVGFRSIERAMDHLAQRHGSQTLRKERLSLPDRVPGQSHLSRSGRRFDLS